MGGMGQKQVDLGPAARVYQRVAGLKGVKLDPFFTWLDTAAQRRAEQAQQTIEQSQAQIYKDYLQAMYNALGSVAGGDKYSERLKNRLQELLQQEIAPTQEAVEQMKQEYSKVASDIAKVLALAGVHQAARALWQPYKGTAAGVSESATASQQIPQLEGVRWLKMAWETGMPTGYVPYFKEVKRSTRPYQKEADKFLEETRSALSQLGLTPEEIDQAMQPFYNALAKGQKFLEQEFKVGSGREKTPPPPEYFPWMTGA